MSPVDMDRALTSENYAFKMWRSYNNGNPYGITDAQFGEIEGAWKSRLGAWQSYTENDNNNYHVTDEDWNNGKDRAESDSGFKNTQGKENKQTWRTVGSAGAAVGNAAGGAWLRNTDKLQWNGIQKKGGKNNSAGAGVLIACGIDAALAIWYRAAKPNEEQKKAIDAYKEQMPALQDECAQNDADMMMYDEELIELGDSAAETVDTANEEMEEQMKEYAKNQAVRDYAQSAVTAGYELTDKDKKEYQNSTQTMTQIGEDVQTMKDDTIEEVGEINEEMLTYEDSYNDVAHDMGEIAGYTATAADIDDQTKVKCYVEAASQGINAANAGLDAKKAFSVASGSNVAFWVSVVYAAAGAVAAVAAVSDGLATAEQYKWAGEIDEEIKLREDVESANNDSIDLYDENIDNYDAYLDDISKQEVEVPDDLEEPDPNLPEPPEPPQKKKPEEENP